MRCAPTPVSEFRKRTPRANLQSVRALVGKGTHRRVRVCTRCLRSGKVAKPAPQPKSKAKPAAA